MIIDAHVHLSGGGTQSLLEQFKNSDVDKAVLLPLTPHTSNSFIGEICRLHPDEFIGFASVNPYTKGAATKLEIAITEYGLKGFKLHPRMQDFRPDDPACFPLYKKAEELGIPILFDTLLNRPTLLKNQVPLLYDEVARVVPDIPIIMAHFGGFMFLEALAVANANKNIYFDISRTLEYFYYTPYREQVKFVFEQVGFDRLIYGSDFPEREIQSNYLLVQSMLQGFGISEQDRDKIFGGNISRILGLSKG